MSTIDLSLLPAPGIVEEIKYEAILSRARQTFMQVWRAIKDANPTVPLPDYDVTLLETDPATISNQSESYREILLRARVNDAIRANLLAFAKGSDLDHLGVFYDAYRMAGESDERYLARIILAIQGRSTGGTEERYKYVAMSDDVTVADAVVYTMGRSPLLHVAVYSTAPDGVASSTLLAKVDAALQAPAVKMVNDTIAVASAVHKVVNIEADIWLLPQASADTLVTAENNLRTSWQTTRGLGRDLTTSWWSSKLMVAGVQRVVPAGSDVLAHPSEAISIGTITLNNRGRDY